MVMFNSNSRALATNKLAKFLIVGFLVVAPMIIIWVLCAQPNVLGLNWMVPIEGRYYLTATLGNQINDAAQNIYHTNIVFPPEELNKFKIYHPLLDKAADPVNGLSENQIKAILHFIPGFGIHYIFNGILLAPIFGVLVFNILLNIILSLTTKSIFLDIFPSSLASWLGTFTLILCGLMPSSHGGENPHQNYWTIAVYIIVIALVWIGSLILFNLLFNKIIIESKIADVYYEKLLRETKENESLKKQALLDNKKNEDENYVDL